MNVQTQALKPAAELAGLDPVQFPNESAEYRAARTALLTEEINKLRPANRRVIIPQIDARLWTHYHTTTWPHHLTQTIMY